MEEMCFVPCARDCQLSSWTSWTACRTEARCGNGVQTRSRYIIEPSLDGGRDCPSTLVDGEVRQSGLPSNTMNICIHHECSDKRKIQTNKLQIHTHSKSYVQLGLQATKMAESIIICIIVFDDKFLRPIFNCYTRHNTTKITTNNLCLLIISPIRSSAVAERPRDARVVENFAKFQRQ